jgi:hypothetical protein
MELAWRWVFYNPIRGFENTYTYNNKNILLGAIASQQPYNAYGARASYDISSISLWGGYYKIT